jgi:hypothetical protein
MPRMVCSPGSDGPWILLTRNPLIGPARSDLRQDLRFFV